MFTPFMPLLITHISLSSHPLFIFTYFQIFTYCTLICFVLTPSMLFYCYSFFFSNFTIILFLSPFSYTFFLTFKNHENSQKIEKILKNEKYSFFALLCLYGQPHHVTLIFKNTKNSFLFLLVSVRPLASYESYFQVIQKTPKKIQNFQNIKISIFSNKNVF